MFQLSPFVLGVQGIDMNPVDDVQKMGAALARRTRLAQGLPSKIRDVVTIRRVVQLLVRDDDLERAKAS